MGTTRSELETVLLSDTQWESVMNVLENAELRSRADGKFDVAEMIQEIRKAIDDQLNSKQ